MKRGYDAMQIVKGIGSVIKSVLWKTQFSRADGFLTLLARAGFNKERKSFDKMGES